MSSSEDDVNFVPIKLQRKRRLPIDTSTLKITKIYNNNLSEELQLYDPSKINLNKNEESSQTSETAKKKKKSTTRAGVILSSSDESEEECPERPLTPPPQDYMTRVGRRGRSNKYKKDSQDLIKKLTAVISQPVSNNFSESRDSDCMLDDEELTENLEKMISIRVSFHQRNHHYFLPEHKSFSYLYQKISQENGVPMDRLFISCSDRKVLLTDTPAKLGDKEVSKLFECVEVAPVQSKFQIHFQSSKARSKRSYQVEESDSIESVCRKYAEEVLETSIDQLVFKFDDEIINWKRSPIDLDIDDGGCIDVVKKPRTIT